MLLDTLAVDPVLFERRTGWSVKPEGACKDELCVPLPPGARRPDGLLDAEALARSLGMPLVADEGHGLWALGPPSVTGRALSSAVAPDIELEDFDGGRFRLASLAGTKVLLLAWASW